MEDLRDLLTVLIDNGYKGFNMFKMNPGVEAAQQEVQWMAQLKEETLRKTVAEARTPQAIHSMGEAAAPGAWPEAAASI